MKNLLLTTDIVLPIFLVMVVGFVVRQIGLIDEKSTRVVNRIVFRVFLPCSLAKSIMGCSKDMAVNWRLMAFCVVGEVAVFLLTMVLVPRFEKINRRKGVIMQAIFRGNYAIFGLPLAEALFPMGDGGVAAMMVLVTVPVYNVMAVVTLEYFQGGKCTVGKLVKGVFKNPLLWGCLAGFVALRLPFSLPQFVTSTVSKLGTIAGPLALFVLGASINPDKLRGNFSALTATTILRLVAVPALTLPLAYFLGFRGAEFAALMVAFATPTATSSFTMAVEMGSDGDLAGQLVMTTSVCSALSLFVIILICKTLCIF